MSDKYFQQATNPAPEESDSFLLLIWTFFAGVLAFVSLYLSVACGLAYFKNARYMDQSVVTQGTVIERIRVPRNKHIPRYYLRYRYENIWALEICPLDVGTRLSPRNRACSVTVDSVEVSEASYRAAVVPSQIQVSYLPSAEESWSQVVGYSSRKTQSLVGSLLSLFLGSGLGIFTIKLVRARRKHRQSL